MALRFESRTRERSLGDSEHVERAKQPSETWIIGGVSYRSRSTRQFRLGAVHSGRIGVSSFRADKKSSTIQLILVIGSDDHAQLNSGEAAGALRIF